MDKPLIDTTNINRFDWLQVIKADGDNWEVKVYGGENFAFIEKISKINFYGEFRLEIVGDVLNISPPKTNQHIFTELIGTILYVSIFPPNIKRSPED
jgi:hypothetical protein